MAKIRFNEQQGFIYVWLQKKILSFKIFFSEFFPIFLKKKWKSTEDKLNFQFPMKLNVIWFRQICFSLSHWLLVIYHKQSSSYKAPDTLDYFVFSLFFFGGRRGDNQTMMMTILLVCCSSILKATCFKNFSCVCVCVWNRLLLLVIIFFLFFYHQLKLCVWHFVKSFLLSFFLFLSFFNIMHLKCYNEMTTRKKNSANR